MESYNGDSEYEEKPSIISFEALDIEENQLTGETSNSSLNNPFIQSPNPLISLAQNQMMSMVPLPTNAMMTGMPNNMLPIMQNPISTDAGTLIPIHVVNPAQLTSNTANFYVIDTQSNWAMPVMTNPTTAALQNSQATILQTATESTNSPIILPNTTPQNFVPPQASVVSTPSSIKLSNVQSLANIISAPPKPPNPPQASSISSVKRVPNIISKKHARSRVTGPTAKPKKISNRTSAPQAQIHTMPVSSTRPEMVPTPPKIPKIDTSGMPMMVSTQTIMDNPLNVPSTSKANEVMVIDLENDAILGPLDNDLLKKPSTTHAAAAAKSVQQKDAFQSKFLFSGSGTKCLVDACYNTTGNPPPGVDFFKLPEDKTIRRIWLKTVERTDLLNDKKHESQICSDHFLKDVMFSKRIKTLKPHAVPYVSKPKNPDRPQKKQKEARAMNRIQNLMNQLKKKLPKRDPAHSRELKYFALNLRIGDPIAYKFFKPLFNLPPERSLRDLQVFIPSYEKMMGCVEAKLRGLPPEARQCALAVTRVKLAKGLYYNITRDEIIGLERLSGLQQIAEQAYVFMIRGLCLPWDQLVGYCMTADVPHAHGLVRHMILEIIQKLTTVGVEVMAIITKENVPVLLQPMTHAKPYYTFNDSKIYHINDVPTLMADLYRTMCKNAFLCENGIVDLSHIYQTYEIMKDHKLLQKLTERHVRPGPEELASPAVAVAVLARPVASAMLLAGCQLPLAAAGTATFINTISDIYDLVNSSPADCNTAPYTFSPEQVEALEKGIAFFSHLKERNLVMDKSNSHISRLQKICVAFVTSLTAMKLLAGELRARGTQRVWTRRFQLKPLDAALVRIQARCLHVPPTPVEFIRAFSKVYLRNLLDHSALVKHSISHSELCAKVRDKFIPMHNSPIVLGIKHEIDYHCKLPDEGPMNVIVSYLVNKCLEQHSCDLTLKYFVVGEDNGNPANHKMRSVSSMSFAIPSAFRDYIDQLEACYYCTSSETIGLSDVGLRLLSKMHRIEFVCPCQCFPRNYLLKLFVRLRLYHTLKFNNGLSKAKNFIAHPLISMRQYFVSDT